MWTPPLVYHAWEGDTWEGYAQTTVFWNTANPDPGPPQGMWHTIDTTVHGVPLEARAVLLRGTMLITSGPTNMYIWVKKFGSNVWNSPQLQCITGTAVNGRRIPFAEQILCTTVSLSYGGKELTP